MYFKKAHQDEPEVKWTTQTTIINTVFVSDDPPLIAVQTSSIIVRLDEE